MDKSVTGMALMIRWLLACIKLGCTTCIVHDERGFGRNEVTTCANLLQGQSRVSHCYMRWDRSTVLNTQPRRNTRACRGSTGLPVVAFDIGRTPISASSPKAAAAWVTVYYEPVHCVLSTSYFAAAIFKHHEFPGELCPSSLVSRSIQLLSRAFPRTIGSGSSKRAGYVKLRRARCRKEATSWSSHRKIGSLMCAHALLASILV